MAQPGSPSHAAVEVATHHFRGDEIRMKMTAASPTAA